MNPIPLPTEYRHGEKRLDLAFRDKTLRFICESEARARKVLGVEAAADLHARLADLEAIDAVTEMDWVPVTFEGTTVRIDFHSGFFLLADANEAKPPLVAGKINWSRVGRLLLREIRRA